MCNCHNIYQTSINIYSAFICTLNQSKAAAADKHVHVRYIVSTSQARSTSLSLQLLPQKCNKSRGATPLQACRGKVITHLITMNAKNNLCKLGSLLNHVFFIFLEKMVMEGFISDPCNL